MRTILLILVYLGFVFLVPKGEVITNHLYWLIVFSTLVLLGNKD